MKKKVLAILLSVLMLTSVTLPGTWATDDTEIPTEETAAGDVVIEEPAPETAPAPAAAAVTEESATESATDTDTESATDSESEDITVVIVPDSEDESATDESESETAESEEESESAESEESAESAEESEAGSEGFNPYTAVEHLYELDSDEAVVAYLQSLTEEELAAVQLILEEYGMWANIAAMMYPEEAPEGMPPEDWGSTSLEGAVPFTNAVSMFSLIPTRAAGDDETDPGVVLNKIAKANTNGGFNITLEAYATGEQTTVSRYEPVDIVLVLDTSGSMYAGMQNSDFEAVYSSSVSIDPDSYYDCYRKYWVIEDGEFVNACVINTTNVKENNAPPLWRTQKNWNTSGSTFYPKTRENDNETNHKQFYVVKSGQSRMDSLKTSVNSFISSVLTTSADSSIAIVPFGTNVGTVTEFTSNQAVLSNAVAALTPDGATNSGAAMAKAVELLNSNDVKNDERNKVVVMFTDGSPCSTGNTFDNSIANAAISNSKTLKANGVTVYTLGVFDGANGAITSVGSSNENTYMHYVSSNYPYATSMTGSGEQNDELDGKSYYLSATNSSQLLNIFQQISQQVGGATNDTLDSSTVVRDIIAPSFTVPANASDVKLYTADCTGAGLTFGNRTPATGVTATITGETLDVTGFDFSANWCGSHSGTYSGKKLIIEFTVSPKEGFLGGNDVPTNGDTSGMYVGDTNIALFEVPTVNVPIQAVTVTAQDKNVYLLGNLTADQIKSDAKVTCGDVTLDLSKADQNYGLESWQTDYVTIEVTYTDEDGNTVTDLSNLTEDTTYTISATVSPKTVNPTSTQGEKAETKSNSATGNIYVFKPELTYKDSEVYNGDSVPTTDEYNSTNYDSTKTVWKHTDGTTVTLASAVTMTGTEPTLSFEYTPDASQINDGKINAYSDTIGVAVTVKIDGTDVTSYTKFNHATCSLVTNCPTLTGFYKFWLHILNTDLTITKIVDQLESGQCFVFKVQIGNGTPLEVVFDASDFGNSTTATKTVKGVKVGQSCTVTEITDWSWRYEIASGYSAEVNKTLVADKTKNAFTFKNVLKNNNWLDGNAYVDNTWKYVDGEWTLPTGNTFPTQNTRFMSVAQAAAYSFGKRYN